MKRLLYIAAPGLVIVGLELSAGTFSTTFERLLAGSSALMAGAEHPIPLPRFAAGLILVLGGLTLTGMSLWSWSMGWAVEARGRSCPECGKETKRIKRRRRDRVRGRLAGLSVTHRTCESCDWSGLSARS